MRKIRADGRPLRALNGQGAEWLEKQLVLSSNKCAVWPFGRHSGGSKGSFWDKSLQQGVDVQAYVCERMHGSRPKSYVLERTCKTPLCCNKKHLRWRLDRKIGPYKQSYAKLTPEQIPIIRSQLERGASTREVARRFNVTSLTISLIGRRKTWAWVE
jgi:hypothetical protein